MSTLQDLVGQVVFVKLAFLDAAQHVKILSLEQFGVWIEAQAITEGMLAMVGALSAPKTPVLFVPFSRIDFVLSSVDIPSLSDRAL